MKQKKPTHLLIRFSDRLLENRGTIEEHQKVIEKEGAVWFGKMGQPISQNAIDKLNKQVEDNIPTFIYLVKGNRRKPTTFISDLVFASKSKPEEEMDLIPPYYNEIEIIQFVKFWAKVTNLHEIDLKDLTKMGVASSVYPLLETLVKSSSGHFYLQEKKSFV
ncbi:MAG: hypothetical protein SVP52_04610 [Chloroflexota bacterium]|nr:hypothetical protein [Chloroflexota bacterium]